MWKIILLRKKKLQIVKNCIVAEETFSAYKVITKLRNLLTSAANMLKAGKMFILSSKISEVSFKVSHANFEQILFYVSYQEGELLKDWNEDFLHVDPITIWIIWLNFINHGTIIWILFELYIVQFINIHHNSVLIKFSTNTPRKIW